MALQYGTTVRNNQLDQVEATAGTAAILRIYTGSAPANCAAAATGTQLSSMTLPTDWMNAASGASKTKLGTWQDAAADATGTAGYFRIWDSTATTCHVQGTCGQSVTIATNALTAANGNVLNFASTTGVVVGMNVSGTGVPAGATVVAVTSTTVTLSHTSTAGVANATSIMFAYDLPLDNASIATGQTVTINTFTLNAGNA